jgi:hypothetical protein
MKDFKEQLRNDFIPRVKAMIIKEKQHIDWLGDFPTTNHIDSMIQDSNQALKHLEYRLKEYEEYVK